MERKQFVRSSLLALSGVVIARGITYAQKQTVAEVAQLKPELVKEFVIAGHGNLEKIKSMLADYPNLIFSRHDWGNGDFEEAIEGAGHVGNKDIANYLIDKGVRVNMYVLAMLGRVDLVKPVLEAYPKLLNAAGPHGFTLLHHAKVGGADAKEMYAYLEQKGLKEMQVKIK